MEQASMYTHFLALPGIEPEILAPESKTVTTVLRSSSKNKNKTTQNQANKTLSRVCGSMSHILNATEACPNSSSLKAMQPLHEIPNENHG